MTLDQLIDFLYTLNTMQQLKLGAIALLLLVLGVLFVNAIRADFKAPRRF